MTNENQPHLNIENSVTHELPAVIDAVAQLRDSAMQTLHAEGFTDQADSSTGFLELNKLVDSLDGQKQHLWITTSSDTSHPTEVRFRQEIEHDEPGGYNLIIQEDTTFQFQTVDGVTHLLVKNVEKDADTGQISGSTITERTDDAADLERLKQLTDGSRIDAHMALLRSGKQRSEAVYQEYSEAVQAASRKAKGGALISRVLSRHRS